MKITIKVTEEDIQQSGRGLHNNPLTRAVQRATRQKWVVLRGRIACRLGWSRCLCLLPYGVAARWKTYRYLRSMQPFEFDLEV
jgi:hypothetical protein